MVIVRSERQLCNDRRYRKLRSGSAPDSRRTDAALPLIALRERRFSSSVLS